MSSPGTTYTSAYTVHYAQFTVDGASGAPTTGNSYSNWIDCDSFTQGMGNTQGCVHHAFRPRYNLSLALYPNIGWGILDAIFNYGKPGRISRLVNSAAIDANRTAACAGFVKINAADSCDEYPFASTYQGGAGAHQQHVPLTENTNQGSQDLGPWLQRNRVFDGEEYDVYVVN